jgi:cytochrome c553
MSKNLKRSLAVLAGAVLSLCGGISFAQQQADKLDRSSKIRLSMCVGCHGPDGYKTAYPEVYHVPRIGGQQQAYLVKALQAYRSGERSHPSMRGIARDLTDEQINELAAYYSGSAK